MLGRQLSGVMLLAIEVAVEYWLALTWSPQAQWLNELAKTGVIQDEVRPTNYTEAVCRQSSFCGWNLKLQPALQCEHAYNWLNCENCRPQSDFGKVQYMALGLGTLVVYAVEH